MIEEKVISNSIKFEAIRHVIEKYERDKTEWEINLLQPYFNEDRPNFEWEAFKQILNVVKEENKDTTTEKDLNEYMIDLEHIFKIDYSSISIRFNKKRVRSNLKSKLRIHSWKEIKRGFSNYIYYNAQQNTELKFIKSIDLFLKDEMYLDYQVMPEIKNTDKHRESLETLMKV